MNLQCPICAASITCVPARVRCVQAGVTCSFRCREELQRRLEEQRFADALGEPLGAFLRRRYAEGATLVELGREIGRDGTQLLRTWFPRYGIATRPPNRGSTPGSVTDKNSAPFARNRDRMRITNPSRNEVSAAKMSITRAAAYRHNPHPHERAVCDALTELRLDFVFQHPIGRYIADFFFPGTALTVEVDARREPHRVAQRASRDVAVTALGYEVVRISYRKRPELTARAVLAFLKNRNLVPCK